jgi:hypothetical protein
VNLNFLQLWMYNLISLVESLVDFGVDGNFGFFVYLEWGGVEIWYRSRVLRKCFAVLCAWCWMW